MTAGVIQRVRASARNRIRDRFGSRDVRREVLGAELVLPWSHRLPDYVRAFPTYGRNLVDLAEALAGETAGTFRVVDLGANIGDSALQILARVDARVLCIDGDQHWLPYLYRNVEHEPRCVVEPSLVVEHVDSTALTAVRQSGTTRFAPSGSGAGASAQITADELRRRHPDFDRVRLIKSDIDGFDCRIVPLLAAAWSDCAPVLFFEYDPAISHSVGDDHPDRVWDALAGLGYDVVAVWDNFGRPLGTGTVAEIKAAAERVFGRDRAARAYDYWDVAVAVAADETAHEVFRRLSPGGAPA